MTSVEKEFVKFNKIDKNIKKALNKISKINKEILDKNTKLKEKTRKVNIKWVM